VRRPSSRKLTIAVSLVTVTLTLSTLTSAAPHPSPLLRYEQQQKRGLVSNHVPFNPALLQDTAPPEVDESGCIIKYIVGWVFVPHHVRDNVHRLIPVSFMDGAHAKAPATGTFFCEAALDGIRRVHPLAVMHVLCTENIWTCPDSRSAA